MKVGSLFTGYGGLDTAVGGELAWYAEIDKAACEVLAYRYPGVPNLGDITKIDWTQVEPVDVLTGGYPCQPFSHAGLRKGKNDDRHLWPYVRDAIHTLRPEYAVLENVSGHITLGFANVLSDLATIGFDAEWGTFRASDVGAPHQRKRLFIIAYPARGTWGEGQGRDYQKSERSTGLATHTGSPTTDTQHDGFTASENRGSIREGIAQGWRVEQEGNERQLEGIHNQHRQ
jgi:DNA (cytosine-5)-methyltransferase 1